jgi:ABC-type dipeptide/oligopeptide/nickel transport system ATPase component
LTDASPLLSINISAGFPGRAGVLSAMCLDVGRGEIIGLVGQSGCGKSTLALAILRLLPLKGGKAEGSILFKNRELMSLNEKQMRALRGNEISLVLQSPIASLNPSLRVGPQMEEAWRVHKPKSSRAECEDALRRTLEEVSLPATGTILRQYPSQLSVGQAQRVLIGMAILHRPALLIADEPTSALDVNTQSEILELFATLSQRLGMGILFISHDLLSVAMISHRVAVMDQGQIVECQDTQSLFSQPNHPVTRKMLGALSPAKSWGQVRPGAPPLSNEPVLQS